jgi:hypothetical protein
MLFFSPAIVEASPKPPSPRDGISKRVGFNSAITGNSPIYASLIQGTPTTRLPPVIAATTFRLQIPVTLVARPFLIKMLSLKKVFLAGWMLMLRMFGLQTFISG